MRLLVSAGVTLLAAAVLFGVGWLSGRQGEKAAQASREELVRDAADAVEARTAERIAAIRVVNQTISGKVREVVRENTVYRDCVIDEPMRRLLDAARAGGQPAAGGGGMPGAGASSSP